MRGVVTVTKMESLNRVRISALAAYGQLCINTLERCMDPFLLELSSIFEYLDKMSRSRHANMTDGKKEYISRPPKIIYSTAMSIVPDRTKADTSIANFDRNKLYFKSIFIGNEWFSFAIAHVQRLPWFCLK